MLLNFLQEIIKYLSSTEIAELYSLNKSFNQKLSDLKAIKQSVWQGALPCSSRAKFWIYQSPLYQYYSIRVQEEVCKILRVSSTISLYSYIHQCMNAGTQLEESTANIDTIKNDILKDIPRTYLVSGNSKEEAQLLNILIAFAYVKPSVGYCQGMNFLAAVILKVTKNEEISFWVLLGLMKKWDMENMYVPGVPDLSLREYQMNHYVNNLLPDLYSHFRKVGVTNGFFISRWFMTLFSTYLDYDILVKVWDCFFLDGWKVIIKVGVTLLREIRPIILNYDLEEISKLLRKNSKSIDYIDVLQKSSQVQVTKTELKKLEEQFYIDQTRFKLAAVENSHVPSEDELVAIRWAKVQFNSFDGTTKNDISEFQKKIQKLDIELENFTKHYLLVTMELLRVQNELEILTEKKNLYSQMYSDMQSKFKNSKISRFVTKILSKNKKSGSTKHNTEKISEQDITMCQQKLKNVSQELLEIQKLHNEKTLNYREAISRAQEINYKKKNYSDQLCEFLNLIK
jgi:Rab-GTPase-TBC domain